MRKRKPKLWLPKTTSFEIYSKKGKVRQKGLYKPDRTKAFVISDTRDLRGRRVPKGLSTKQRGYLLRRVAQKSPFYIKRLNPKALTIMRILERNGIRVEKPVQNLKDGSYLFKREGFGLDSPAGKKLFERNANQYAEKIIETIVRMHSLGIIHNHPHLGNWAIRPNGELVLLDFRKATYSSEAQRKGFENPKAIEETWKVCHIFDLVVKEIAERKMKENNVHEMAIYEAQRNAPNWMTVKAIEIQVKILKKAGKVKEIAKIALGKSNFGETGWRYNALEALEEIGSEEARRCLRELLKDKNREIRGTSIGILSKLRDKPSLKKIVSMLLKYNEYGLNSRGLNAAIDFIAEVSPKDLNRLAFKSRDRKVRHSALEKFSEKFGKRSVNTLLRKLRSPDEAITAAKELARLKATEAIPYIVKAIEADSGGYQVNPFLDALADIAPSKAIQESNKMMKKWKNERMKKEKGGILRKLRMEMEILIALTKTKAQGMSEKGCKPSVKRHKLLFAGEIRRMAKGDKELASFLGKSKYLTINYYSYGPSVNLTDRKPRNKKEIILRTSDLMRK